MAVFIVCPSGGEYTGVDLRNGQLQENLRHQDTLCVSVLTLSTIMVGGLFAFFRFPALPGTWGLNPGTVTTVPVVLGMVVAVVLYAMCIWRGMRILANNNLFGKIRAFRSLRGLVTVLAAMVFIVVLATFSTRLQSDPTMDKPPAGGGRSHWMTSGVWAWN